MAGDADDDAGVDVDATDRRIIDALLREGRASVRDLAAAAGVSTATVTTRLQRLEDAGVIRGHRPEVDYAALGYEVTAIFKLDVVGDGLEAVVADLESTGRMTGVYEVTGSHDVLAVGKFTSTDEMNEQIKRLLTSEHVRAATTNVVLDTVCEDDQFPVTADDEN